ncbi:MAG TPA: ATP synthase F1 subunit delta [Phnomibacter sp.]|nr:ATP synthase F1 subunit delta [Phnomibacter sp.]
MVNPRLAARYAKSLIDLAIEQNQLEQVKQEVDFILHAFKLSPEFKTLLRSPVIKGDKKMAILREVGKGRFNPLMAGFMRLLILKGRENVLPEIFETFNAQYNEHKGIHEVTITTAQPVSDELKANLLEKIKAETKLGQVELKTKVKEELIGGFVLEYNNNLVDASISRMLKDVRRDFVSNEYTYRIR